MQYVAKSWRMQLHIDVKLLTMGWTMHRGNDREAEFSRSVFSENLIAIEIFNLSWSSTNRSM